MNDGPPKPPRLWRNLAVAAVTLFIAAPIGCLAALKYERSRFGPDTLRGMTEEQVIARFGPPYSDTRKLEPHPRDFILTCWGLWNLDCYNVAFRDGRVHSVYFGGSG